LKIKLLLHRLRLLEIPEGFQIRYGQKATGKHHSTVPSMGTFQEGMNFFV